MSMAAVIRFTGAGLVIASGVLCGSFAAGRLEKRLRVLEELRAALERLITLVEYQSATLAAALDEAARPCSGAPRAFLERVSQNLRSGDGDPAGKAWASALDSLGGLLLVDRADIDALRLLGPALGVSDRKDQARHLAAMIGKLGVHIGEARDRSAKYALLYRQMGLLCGALVALILV
jgi:stage III sporulation protein AB